MINIINKIDFLSPSITLFHLEKRTHTSNVGGVFVLLMLSIISAYICVLLYDLVTHKRITSLFHKKFKYEAGYYSFNSSSIFHFLQIFSQEDGGYYDSFDSKYIRVYTTYVTSNFSNDNIDDSDHWVFDSCRESIDNKNIESYLFENVENFTKGVCIRYYFNSTERKYYSLEEEGFQWPHLEHGIAQRNNIYLTTIVKKCSNDSVISELFGYCADSLDIEKYVTKYLSIHLYFTDTQVDPTNFSNPVQKYLQVINAEISQSHTFIENYIYFAPLKIMTTIGTLFANSLEFNSFYFDFNMKGSAHLDEQSCIITKFYHLMQNNVQIYERKYNNLLDVFSEIGGVIQFIFYLFYWINFVYNKYIIAYDTNSLLFSIRDNINVSSKEEYNNQKNNLNNNDIKLLNLKAGYPNVRKSKDLINKKYLIANNSKENNMNKEKELIVFGNDKKNKNKNDIINNKNKNAESILKIQKRLTPIRSQTNLCLNPNSSNLFLKENANNSQNNSFGEIYKKLEINLGKDAKNKYNKSNLNLISLSSKSLGKIEHRHKKKGETSDQKLKSIKIFSFKDFLKSIIFKRNKGNHYFIEVFRKHLLSEEHFLKNHIKMVLLTKKYKFGGDENTNVLECFNEL